MASNFGPGAPPPAPPPGPPQLPPSQLPPPQPVDPGPRDLSGQFCPNCGAPLTAAEGRACKFCGESLMPYFAPQVARARERGTARGVLYAGLGCLAVVVIGIMSLIGLAVVAIVHQHGNSENGYSCSPGPCASASGASLKVTRISFGSLPAASSGTYGVSSFVRILIEIDASGGAQTTVRSADFGLIDRGGHPRPAATGFSPCQAWTEIDAPGSGSTIPAVCFAVNDAEITHYKLTWARLQPGQTISLYMPS